MSHRKEERILKQAYDINERKREDARRLEEEWLQEDIRQAREKYKDVKKEEEAESESEYSSEESEKKEKLRSM